MRFRKLLCAALSAFLIWTACAPARAEAVSAEAAARALEELTEEKGLTLGESSVAYPALREGAAEEELRQRINERILEDSGIREYVSRVSQLISGGKLNVSWQGAVLGDVFSFSVSAEGAVTSPRPTHVWTAGNIDLRDGHEITAEEIFTDPEKARERMEAFLEDEVAPELSAHLLNSELTPVPELFRMSERGIILLYPIERLSTLSDRAGDVLIPWSVIRDELDLSEGGVMAATGLAGWLNPAAEDPETAERIRSWTADGAFPGIPVRLGDSVQALTDSRHLLTDPDVYAGGRFFAPEGADFQGVLVSTDFLSESWENSIVDGIRADLGSFFGLTVGETTVDAWRGLLGEPDHTIEMDADQAEAYRTVPGSRDYYEFGGHRLQLQGNEDGLLVSMMITE